MTKEQLKAELTALYDQILTAGDIPEAECLKLIDLWSDKEQVREIQNDDPSFKTKGRLVTGILQLMLVEAQRLEEIKAKFVSRITTRDGGTN